MHRIKSSLVYEIAKGSRRLNIYIYIYTLNICSTEGYSVNFADTWATWSNWMAWTPWSASCGSGTRSKWRLCITMDSCSLGCQTGANGVGSTLTESSSSIGAYTTWVRVIMYSLASCVYLVYFDFHVYLVLMYLFKCSNLCHIHRNYFADRKSPYYSNMHRLAGRRGQLLAE